MKKATVLEALNSFGDEVDLEKLIGKLLAIKKNEVKSYDPEFVAMVQRGDVDLEAGKGVKVDIDNLESQPSIE